MAWAFVTAVTIDTESCCHGANKFYYVCRMSVGRVQKWSWTQWRSPVGVLLYLSIHRQDVSLMWKFFLIVVVLIYFKEMWMQHNILTGKMLINLHFFGFEVRKRNNVPFTHRLQDSKIFSLVEPWKTSRITWYNYPILLMAEKLVLLREKTTSGQSGANQPSTWLWNVFKRGTCNNQTEGPLIKTTTKNKDLIRADASH